MPIAQALKKKRNHSLYAVPFFIFILLFSSLSQAEERAKWALGLGAGWLQDYPGSDQGRIRFLPFPVYRGKTFRIDRATGVEGKVFDTSRLSFSWNFIFQFPTESEAITVRKGMPNLDWVLSIGPQMKYVLWRSSNQTFFFRFPARLNTCTNFSKVTRFCGIAFNPGFRHAIRTKKYGDFTARLEAFSHTSEYHQYFYEVHPDYATASRPAFHARSGFLGTVTGLFHSLPFKGWELVSSFNVYEYGMNVNRESPLFRKTTNLAVFFAATIDFK